MQISRIGTSFAGLWGSKKKQKPQEGVAKVTHPTQDFFEIQKNLGSWRVSIVSRNSSKAHNLRIEKIDGSCGDYYNVNGFALEHNSQAGHAGGAYGCFLDRDEKELVDEYIKLLKNNYAKEEDIDRLVSDVLKPALEKHGEGPLYF